MTDLANPKTFSELNLKDELVRAIQDIGYESPSPIQEKSIPVILSGRDLVGQAQTGTGKTGAFALPMLNKIDLSKRELQVLVLTPTRELAIQVSEAFQTYARHLGEFHTVPIYGGQSMDGQLKRLRHGVHVVVGTPGRVLDHIRRKTLKLETIKMFVLDEADEMLNMGFQEDVELILSSTSKEKQVALFSATMPEQIRRIAQKHLQNPVEIKIQSKTTTVEAIEQSYWQVSGVHKLDALTRLLETEEFEAILIFVRTRNATVELAEKLEARGYPAAALNGDMNQAIRQKTIERLKNGKLDIVIATDVAARGLDVDRISHVINYEIPHNTEAYVHRIGRTGRAGRKGKAILFISGREMRMLRSIEKATRQTINEWELPSKEDVANRRITAFKEKLSEALQGTDDLPFFAQIIKEFQNETGEQLHEIAGALVYLLQKDQPLRFSGEVKTNASFKEDREFSRSSGGDRDRKSPSHRDKRKDGRHDRFSEKKKFTGGKPGGSKGFGAGGQGKGNAGSPKGPGGPNRSKKKKR